MDKNVLSYIGFQPKYLKNQSYLESSIRKLKMCIHVLCTFLTFLNNVIFVEIVPSTRDLYSNIIRVAVSPQGHSNKSFFITTKEEEQR